VNASTGSGKTRSIIESIMDSLHFDGKKADSSSSGGVYVFYMTSFVNTLNQNRNDWHDYVKKHGGKNSQKKDVSLRTMVL
jgi:Lhr-like helicase